MPTDESGETPSFDDRVELLSYLIKRQNHQTFDAPIILPRNLAHPVPLSFAEERLWFLDQLENGSPVYNLVRVERLRGNLDVDAFEKSVAAVICRHEILRTLFLSENGLANQMILDSTDFLVRFQGGDHREASQLLRRIDLRSLPKEERLAAAVRSAVGDAQANFDLSRGPLLRVSLFELDENERIFVLIVHQIVFDWLSHDLFGRELAHFYQGLRVGAPATLPDLKIQYADFSVWQRDWMSGDKLNAHLAFWKTRLTGNSPVLALPTDYSRPVTNSFRGARRSVVIPETLTGELKAFSHAGKATLFMTVMAALQVLLCRYTGQGDVVVGFPIGNRDFLEIEPLIGFFANTLILRTDLHDSPTFTETLERVRQEVVSVLAHQDLPFEKLVDEVHLPRDLTRNPLFQIMLIFQNHRFSKLELVGISAEPLEVDPGTSKFDLTLSLVESEDKLAGFFEYSTDLFDHSTIERMVEHYQTLLEGIITDPEQPISTLPLLTAEEKYQLLVDWNDTEVDYPRDSCIHELFEAQVDRTPEVIAVQVEGKQLTYRELNSRANQLAHYLQGLGVGPEKLVGICVQRSLEMVVGLLGILKAGGAYVPLDSGYPEERLRFMLEDAQISVLLTQESLVEDGRWIDDNSQSSILDPRLTVVCLDRAWGKIAQQSEENLGKRATTQNLAYVIYTSGSTGTPKGVQVEHRSVINCLHSLGKRLGFAEPDVLLAVTPISFDIAGVELYLPLLVGGKLVVAGREDVMDGRELMSRLTECSATAMQATPSTWRSLLEAEWQGAPAFKILCGGETLSRKLADRLLECGTLWNLYGPTETTIWSTVFKVETGEVPVFIGRPFSNTRIYILDSHLQVVPIGVYGEIYIGGDGLARGYLNRPELTAERFVPDPFSGTPGARLYRTGDRARYRPDGNIEFLGRVDDQVKIRGYRVEPGEIEAALNQHSLIKETVVVARARDLSEEKELIGYIVSTQEWSVSVGELRRFLAAKLPDYMIPSWFVFLDAIPLTPNGKINRNALPPPDGERPALDQRFVEPRSEIEELVANVWRDVLKLEKIGVHDNFFDLGGHSLLATRVVARLRNNFNIDLPLRKLFELPTVAGLAEHVDFLFRNQKGISVPPIVPVPRDRPIPLSSSQRRLWFLQKLDPRLIAYNIPATFRITGALNVQALKQALDEIVNRHEILRTRIVEIDGQPLQEILPNAAFELRVVDLSDVPDGEAEAIRVSADDARQPYNLAEAPLMRAKLLRLNEQELVLILNFHHIVCDGSSLIIFYHELAALYEAILGGKVSALPSLPVQYADYAVWQHEKLRGEILESQLAYWKRQLGAGLTTLNLPTDYERPVMQTYHGARLRRTLSNELTKGLKDLSRREGVTLFMTLLATLDILLSRHTGQDDIIVGSTIAGRNRPETDGLIGFFINALALRTDLSGNPTFLELLKRVREVCLDAYTHQDMPFERVVEEINPQRDLSRNPLFQVMFNMADTSERVLKFAGCQIIKLLSSEPEAKFDIVLHAPEVDGHIEFAMGYNADLFSEHRIVNLLGQFLYLLSQVAADPQRVIDEFSLATPAAVSAIPDPTEPLDDTWEGSIHELFAKQTERVPNFPALIDSDNCWTYRELEQHSNQLANYLIAQGIKPKDIVAIYAQRSAVLVVTLLGILKAGAAFEILDPAYPASRLISYLRIAMPRAFLHIESAGETAHELAEFLENLHLCCQTTIPNTKLSSENDPLNDYPALHPNVPIQPYEPAYVAFTSGSTGEPKGVLSRHGPITHFLPWQREAFGLMQTDRFALLSGLAYNHLHRDIFTALYLGATLYVPPADIVREPSRLAEWLRENSISVLHLTPALGQLLLTAGTQPLPAVRRVFFGGDVLTREAVSRIRALAPNATIGSFYGATETQRAVGYYEIPLNFPWKDIEANRPIPLGRGIKDVQLLLLNKAGRLAGVGELAELYVRSPHLAAGYLGDEERTHEMLVINPFTNDSKDRMYKTGELARYLADGNVEWAGRNDRRVNIRGFRVELEEVEAVIKQHPAVQNAAVVLQDCEISAPENLKPEKRNRNLDQRLVAYVVAEEEQQSLVDLLHSYVSTRLPDYMVPSYFVVLDRLPLSPNGKLDYKALPHAERSLMEQTEKFVAPRNDLEMKLCEIFSQVLQRKQVGINDNFFRLGGHSLRAAQAAARIKEAFGLGLELRTFLESPTVTALAKHIATRIKPTPAIDDTDREEIEL